MNGRLILPIVLGIVAVSAAVGLYAIYADDPSECVIEYYDGSVRLGIQEVSAEGVEIREYDGGHRARSHTFFGWNSSPDGTGEMYHPFSSGSPERSLRLYAVVVDGNMSVNGGIADFDMSDLPDDGKPVFIDTSHAEGVREVRISSETVLDMDSMDKSVKVDFGRMCTVHLDSVVVSQCSSAMGTTSHDLILRIESCDSDSFEFTMVAGGSEIGSLDVGTVSVDIHYPRSFRDSELIVLEDGIKEIDTSSGDGMLSFIFHDLTEFKILELVPLKVKLGGREVGPETISDLDLVADGSESFVRWGLFAEGDTFTLSSESKAMHFKVSGADRSDDGSYRVNGGSAVLIDMVEGTATYSIIVPEKQTGFTLTADVTSVKEGGRCILAYSLTGGYEDADLLITVNDLAVEMDSMKRIYLSDIRCDKVVKVTGVYDQRTYGISVPEEQSGYVMSASEDRVHHGQSYQLEFEMLPGYKADPDFRVLLNGSLELDVSSGNVIVDDVQANQVISVYGVSEEEYPIHAGSNTILMINGSSAVTATINDVISVEACSGYEIPETYGRNIGENISAVQGGYKVSGEATFPSVVKLEIGDNIVVNGSPEGKHICVCTNDALTVSVESGYSFPSDYEEKLLKEGCTKNSSGKFIFDKNFIIPSIYKITYMDFSKIHEVFFKVEGDVLSYPISNPSERAYEFAGWETSESTVKGDMIVKSIWNPCTFSVYFGNNLKVQIGENVYTFKESGSYPPRAISIKSNEMFKVSTLSGLDLPSGYGPDNENGVLCKEFYKVVGNCSFPSVSYVYYKDSISRGEYTEVAITESTYNTISKPSWTNDGYEFLGWKMNNQFVSQINISDANYVLIAEWRLLRIG